MTSNPGPKLKTLLDSFVRIRLVQMGGVDLSVFQFDPFLSWSLFFMNGDKTIYGRFGSASPNTKRNRKDSNPNHTTAGLRAALEGALGVHREYTKDPKKWTKILAGKTGPKPAWKTIESNPIARKYQRLGRMKGTDPRGCAHCHEVQRSLIDSYILTKKRITDDMLWLYPQPEILGLKLSRDYSARVTEVAKGSFAERAGVKPGDDIGTLQGQPILSVADVQFVLQNFPDAGGALTIQVLRRDKNQELPILGRVIASRMTLPRLWRRTEDFGWRYRVAGYAMWLWTGVTLADHPKGVRVANLSPRWFKKPNWKARSQFKPGDIIVEADGKKGWTRSTFLAYLMRDKKLGSTVRMRLIRRGQTIDVQFPIPTKQPEVLGH